MTSRPETRYGPMLFDASDVTQLIKRRGQIQTLVAQQLYPSRVNFRDFTSPDQLRSAAIGQTYCYYTANTFCTFPVTMLNLARGTSTQTISLPSS
jgi:hypothetical protein